MNNQNLKPWGPGNPPPRSPGRPRKQPITSAYEERLEVPLPPEVCRVLKLPAKSTWLDGIVEQQFKTALRPTETGNNARAEIANRIEGKPAQKLEVSRGEGIEFNVVYAPAIANTVSLAELLKSVGREKIEEAIDATPVEQKQSEADAAQLPEPGDDDAPK